MLSLTHIRTQVIGAVIGTGIALGVYGAYTVASPALAGWLTRPVAATESKFTDADRKVKQEEIIERAKEILQSLEEK